MIWIVRCHKKMTIQLPDGVAKVSGEMMLCPSQCPYKNSVGCAKTTEFKVTVPQQFTDEAAAQKYRPVKYSEKEIQQLSPKGNLSTSSSVSNTPSETKLSNTTVDSTPSGESLKSNVEIPHKYSSFGQSRRKTENTSLNIVEKLKPMKNYEMFEIGGVYFSDNDSVRCNFQAYPLKNALWQIFIHWDTSVVFKNGNELRDEFIWLITSTLEYEVTSDEIQKILKNNAYNLSQKFFYIFYDVVFKYSLPKGFYWCDQRLSLDTLTAYFENRLDFTKKYCDTGTQGALFRNFYRVRRKEILHYLRIEDENKFFEDMTFDFANECQKVVFIDRHKDYTPIHLGTIEAFIQNMQIPSKLSKMQRMISFLEKYRISEEGIILRSSNHIFEKSERGKLQEDKSMFSVLSLESSASYASEYDCYVTLLREYVKSFSPEEVKIGTLIFTKSNYSNEIKNVASDLCKTSFTRVSESDKEEKKGCAWLTKSIYERNILCTFNCENKTYIEKIMDLISFPTLPKYFSLYNIPTFQIDSKEYTIHDYIGSFMEEDAYTICGVFREDLIIREFFNFRIPQTAKLNMDSIYGEYQKQYEDFLKQSSCR